MPHDRQTTKDAACAVWALPDQADLAREALRHAGLRPTLAASPTRAGPRALADALGCEHAESFRSMVRAGAACALLLAPAPTEPSAGLHDPALLRSLRERATRIVTLEPVPTSVRDAAALAEADLSEVVHIGPLLRHAQGGRAALTALETFGSIRVAALTAAGRVGEGTLAARLVDAMDWMLAILGEPESIDACVHGPRSSAGLTLAPGESLATLTGDLTAHLRFATGASATVTLSDRSGRWFRGATLHGDAGVLRVVDDHMEWLDEAGGAGDAATRAAKRPGAAEAIAGAIEAALEGRAPTERPFDFLRTLAMAEAAVLSARTGQAESPATLLRMAGAA